MWKVKYVAEMKCLLKGSDNGRKKDVKVMGYPCPREIIITMKFSYVFFACKVTVWPFL